MPYVSVDWKLMEDFVTDVFVAYGVPAEDAPVVTDILLESDRRGIESHGVNRFKSIYLDRIKAGVQKPVTHITVVKETPATAILDGGDGMGQVVSRKAMEIAMEKAKKLGIGMAAVQNSTHYGIAGYYVTMAARQGCVGITGTNARPSIAPTFGTENMMGTNPLTVGFPTDEEFDFVLDCATSITQRGKLEYYDRIGMDTPAGQVIGADGLAKTDTHAILEELNTGQAALTPLGGIGEELAGYKGYGYATVVEVLSAALQQGNFLWALNGITDGRKVPFHLRPSWGAKNSKNAPGASCANSVPRGKRPDATVSIRRGKKSIYFGRNARTPACPSAKGCKKS
jgi:LDH2 family malate/lactate/ureidoglycolate dehydrogenase